MNKMLKLPLFLGVVGCLCGGILALTNFVTKDKIASDEQARLNAAYIAHFDDLKHIQEESVSETLAKAGVTEKRYVYNVDKQYIGTIYTVAATGYAGKSSPITFTVSFSSGKVHHYVEISHSESAVGAKFMSWLKDDNNGDRVGNLSEGKTISGSSVSYKAVNDAVNACSTDYLAEYTTIGNYTGGEN